MAAKSNETKGKKTSVSNDKLKIKKLEEEMALLKKMLINNNVNQSSSSDRDILFISLWEGKLNLSTEGNGQGEIYEFPEFGYELVIPYYHAKSVVKNNKRFIRDGRVYIADEDFIKSERLEKDYEKILDKDNILNLFEQNRKQFENIFSKITSKQQEIISNIIKTRLIKEEEVDGNIIDVVDKYLNSNIRDNVNFSKSITTTKNE